MRFEALLERLGVVRALRFVGIRQAPAEAIAHLTYYLLVILVVQTAFDTVGLVIVSNAIGAFFQFFPKLVAAAVVLLLGNAIGLFVGRSVAQSADESGVEFASLLGRVASALILVLSAVMALSQLDFDTSLILMVTMIVLAGFALMFAISFGLGTRDITRNLVAGFYARKLFQPGDDVEIQGQRGVLRAITPVQTVLEHGEERITVSSWNFVQENVRSRRAD